MFARSILVFVLSSTAAFGASFVNFESPHVSPIDMSPDGTLLAICNTADNRVELFDITTGIPQTIVSIPVGYDPVSVRFRTDDELWVVNQVSDSVSVINLNTGTVTATVDTRIAPSGAFPLGQTPLDFGDEPADVVFAGTPSMAYISCSQSNVVLVVDPGDPGAGAVEHIEIFGEDPRMMAVSATGDKVYVAIFESGNASTILGGGLETIEGLLPNVVSDTGPYGGVNPPPNVGAAFDPPVNVALPTPLKVGLIVKKKNGQWLDDHDAAGDGVREGMDWTLWVSGANAAASGRVVGWDLADNDVAVIDTSDNSVTYLPGLMNMCMALAINPGTDDVTVVGTDATNERRFEPNVNGTFIRVNLAIVDPASPGTPTIVDLNGHLDYSTPTVAQPQRDLSIGDPRSIVWNSAGTVGYVSGMGSNNVVVIDSTGARINAIPTELREGPTGLILDEARGRLYVLNKFDASISVVLTITDLEVANVAYFDPTPPEIKTGRKHLYDTHKNSGLGQIACGSCHVDSRTDRLAWDLGDPSGVMKTNADQNLGAGVPGLTAGFLDFHPMKGPMTTQPFTDIIGKEPLHWRGDRRGLEEFNPAFIGLQGDDAALTNGEMQEFKDFLGTIHFVPNPFRNLDNSLPVDVPIVGQFSSGRFGGTTRGDPMPNGDAERGLRLFMGTEPRGDTTLDGPFNCVTCHTLPLGNGADSFWDGGQFLPFPLDANGNHHVALNSVDGSTNRAIKIPQLRSAYEKLGMDNTNQASRHGFGILHDGSVDSLVTFLSASVFNPFNDQDVSDLVALVLAFSGSGFEDTPQNPMPGLSESPPSLQTSKDSHAAVGKQVTLMGLPKGFLLLDELIALADAGVIDLIAKTFVDGVERGYLYLGANLFQPDDIVDPITRAELEAIAGPGTEVTFTGVPVGTGTRLGIDRDEDGAYDFEEVQAGSDPTRADSVPAIIPVGGYASLVLAMLALVAVSALMMRRRRVKG